MKSHKMGKKHISLVVAFVAQGERRKQFSWVVTPKCRSEGPCCAAAPGSTSQFQTQSENVLPPSRAWDEPESRNSLSISETPLGQPGSGLCPLWERVGLGNVLVFLSLSAVEGQRLKERAVIGLRTAVSDVRALTCS